MLESAIERSCVAYLKKLGYLAIKQTSAKGIPDRLIVTDKGKAFFIEFKSARGVLSPHQVWWKMRLENRGFKVLIIRSKDELAEWITDNL